MQLEQTILRGGEPLVILTVRLVCMHATGKAARIPAALRDILRNYLIQEAD